MKKMNNKGFSLIELIIVIAIMAVLVAIIAPNLTRYLGKSKQETDKTNLAEMKKQVKNAIAEAATADPEIDVQQTDGTKAEYIIDGNTCSATSSGTGTTAFATLIQNVLDTDNKSASKATPANKYIKIEISGTVSGGYTITATHVSTS